MHTTKHLRLAASQSTPKTWGEGYISGFEEGSAQGRRDSGIEWIAIGFIVGGAVAGFLCWWLA